MTALQILTSGLATGALIGSFIGGAPEGLIAAAVGLGCLVIAQAIEAQSAKTAGLDAKHDSPVGKADAPRRSGHA